MKTMYTSPDLEIVKFTAMETIASGSLMPSGGEVDETQDVEPFNSGNLWN